jgi:hypothetical protein
MQRQCQTEVPKDSRRGVGDLLRWDVFRGGEGAAQLNEVPDTGMAAKKHFQWGGGCDFLWTGLIEDTDQVHVPMLRRLVGIVEDKDHKFNFLYWSVT